MKNPIKLIKEMIDVRKHRKLLKKETEKLPEYVSAVSDDDQDSTDTYEEESDDH